jgi:lipopolysaccharide/colanic/teichoic acid biosynthesis glycosyltransferase
MFDLFVSALGIVILAPVFIVIAALVKLDSTGPALFRQERVGLRGRMFRIHKFRTMRVSEGGPQVTAANDMRITRTGIYLRRFKLDELPQLFDVLVGNMSLVGPRPEVQRYVSHWPEDARREILSVRPGITDPVTLGIFDEAKMLEGAQDPERKYIDEVLPLKVQGYLRYVRERSLIGDLRLVLGTVIRAFRG